MHFSCVYDVHANHRCTPKRFTRLLCRPDTLTFWPSLQRWKSRGGGKRKKRKGTQKGPPIEDVAKKMDTKWAANVVIMDSDEADVVAKRRDTKRAADAVTMDSDEDNVITKKRDKKRAAKITAWLNLFEVI